MVCDIDFIVITGNILRSVNDIPIVKPGISLYRRSLYDLIPRFCPIHFTITFAGQTNVDRYTEYRYIQNIVIPGISSYREYRYTEDR